jgi:3-oxoacyl-[acyl-carrier protein] reductase
VLTPLTDYAVAIVTGGSCGMGRQIARALANRGYAIVVAYLRDQGEAQSVVEEIVAADGAALAVRADLADELDAERLFSETTAAFGAVDVVVHTERRGTSVLYSQAARSLRDGGAIINVSGSDAIDPELADELRAHYITVNAAVPGLEAPGASHDFTDLVTFLDRWRLIPGP